MPVPSVMGSAKSINFQPTGNGKGGGIGDFVLTLAEMNLFTGLFGKTASASPLYTATCGIINRSCSSSISGRMLTRRNAREV
jgi:hypothetical protein